MKMAYNGKEASDYEEIGNLTLSTVIMIFKHHQIDAFERLGKRLRGLQRC
jgi:hypothetical protein